MMNFNEICQLAETDRDEIYGLRLGSDRFGYDAVGFVGDIVSTVKESVESPYQRGKREKRANLEVYRAAYQASGEFSYEDAIHVDRVSQHRAEMSFVAGAVRSGLIDPITEDDLLDA